MKTTDDLIRIAAAGGGIDLSNTPKTTPDLIRIAAAAAGKGSQIWINGNKTTDDLLRICSAGRGSVMVRFPD